MASSAARSTKYLSAKQWWSQAWWNALSNRAVHDANRLPRGRTYARKGAVEIESVNIGVVEASVVGSRPLPYSTKLFLKSYNQESLEVIIRIMGSRVDFLAALLTGEVPIELEQELVREEVPLLPSSGELSFSCSCPDWADPCKHAAALCYAFSEELESDPFQLLLLRGIEKIPLVDRLRSVRTKTTLSQPSEPTLYGNFVPLASFGTEPASQDSNLGLLTDLLGRWSSESGSPNDEFGTFRSPSSGVDERPGVASILGFAAGRARELVETGRDPGLSTCAEVNVARFVAEGHNGPGGGELSIDRSLIGGNLQDLIAAYSLASDEGVKTFVKGAKLNKKSISMAQRAFSNFYAGLLFSSEMALPEVVASSSEVSCGDFQLRRSDLGNWFLLGRKQTGWEVVAGPAAVLDELFIELD
ncbi:MAG: hypothetical protein HKL81_08190 [Acidimicrobiaceae bacterium]|nr:hypothetical protein [Acidimicrobiaceae bacterium]